VKSGWTLLAAIALALFAGCKKGNDLVGTWTNDDPVNGMQQHSEDTYQPDGTYRSVTKTVAPRGLTVLSTDTGRWSLQNEDSLTLIITDIDWQFQGISGNLLARAQERFRQRKHLLIDSVNKESPMRIVWKDSNEFTAITKKMTFNYYRKTGS
jgi:hypothetical protein